MLFKTPMPSYNHAQRRHSGILAVISLLLLLALLSIAGCSNKPEETPEIRLQNWLTQMETAVKAKNIGDIKALISPDYQDAKGNTRQAVMLKMQLWFRRYDNIGLSSSISAIDVMPNTASMVVEVQFSQSQIFAQMGMSENRYQFVLLFEADGDDWLLSSLSYKPQQ